MQTTRWSADDNKVHPKRPEKGGRRCGYPKQRNEAIEFPTPRIEAGAAEKRDQVTAAFLGNRAPHSAIGIQSPYKLLHGTEPDLRLLRVIGARAFVHIKTPNA